MSELVLKNLSKEFDGKTVLSDFNLEVNSGEFIVLVGPSGSGKSTILRLISGLEKPTAGEIWIEGKLVNEILPKDRDLAMVFQNYALYPHMTVFDNVAFPLKLRKFSKPEIKAKVEEVAHLLGLEKFLNRKPATLSGGQRQRVALGRAIIRKPKLFLFDEPLSNLDAQLRSGLRAELFRLQKKLKTTSVYVTHDQLEAMTLGDRVVVLKDGVAQQEGKPDVLYHRPANKFVAEFIGSPAMNFISGKIEGREFVAPPKICLPGLALPRDSHGDSDVILGVRPEDISVNPAGQDGSFKVTLEYWEPAGGESYLYFSLGNARLVAKYMGQHKFRIGEELEVGLNPTKLHFFNSKTGDRLD